MSEPSFDAEHRGSGPWHRDPSTAGALLLLTVASGGLDAVAFISMGGTFVSNQTGTLLLLGMSVSGADVGSVAALASSLLCFAAGAALAARLIPRRPATARWPSRIPLAMVGELVLVGITIGLRYARVSLGLVVAPVAVAMGIQMTLARRIGLPNLTTGYITGTTTAMISGSPAGDRSNRFWWYGAAPLVALGGGALGAGLIVRASTTAALVCVWIAIALAVLFVRPRNAVSVRDTTAEAVDPPPPD